MPRDIKSSLPLEPLPGSVAIETPLATPASAATSYDEALHYLYSRINYEKIGHAPYNAGNYRLDRMRQLLQRLDNPQRNYPILHVAGTKGKGSTSTLLAAALTACGRRVGLYTSPHLLRLEERIQVNGSSCTPWDLVELTTAVRTAAAELEEQGQGRATFFEMTTAMGLLHFARQGTDAVVLEVGLGGRLDSTNVCQPIVSIITSISLDHQAQLGHSLAAIAREKAGIIKAGTPVVCSTQAPEARAAIIAVAQSQQAPLQLIDRDFSHTWRVVQDTGPQPPAAMAESYRAEVRFQSAGVCPLEWQQAAWPTRMLGRHQADNIAAALATLAWLRQLGWELPADKLRPAIAAAQPPARLQIVALQPLSIIDSAHNPASVTAGLEALEQHFPRRPRTIVFASSRDKDYRGMLQRLLVSGQQLWLTAYCENPRALPVEELAAVASEMAAQLPPELRPRIELARAPAEAWARAQTESPPGNVVYATGSFFLAAELLAHSPVPEGSQSDGPAGADGGVLGR